MKQHFDNIVIGSGLAGLSAALQLASRQQVALISKQRLEDSSSAYAQGGIACAIAPQDSESAHIADTLAAGAGLSNLASVAFVVKNAHRAIHWLVEQGVTFSREPNDAYHLHQEGGHQHRRVLHVADSTGAAIIDTLIKKVRCHPNIQLFDAHTAIALIVNRQAPPQNQCCLGVIVDNHEQRYALHASNTILATGGVANLYSRSTNPKGINGDGIAMAWHAGCRVSNMEFIQFHPTCLALPQAPSFLISEALRGEGGVLRLANGKRFMDVYDSRAELAPRDIVAQAIAKIMQQQHLACVYLDIRHQGRAFIQKRFPNIYRRCLAFGLDISQELIPVAPAAHYSCGGIVTNHQGQTDLRQLYAIGEVACTGLHGANRLASNSLLECVVSALAAADTILQTQPKPIYPNLALLAEKALSRQPLETAHRAIQELRTLMWDKVGIVRNQQGLQQAQQQLAALKAQLPPVLVYEAQLALRNGLQVAQLILDSAIRRHESRGSHYHQDYPHRLDAAMPSILTPPRSTAHPNTQPPQVLSTTTIRP